MAIGYVLYNSKAGTSNNIENLKVLEGKIDAELEFVDVVSIKDYRDIFAKLGKEDIIILAGGDGTINRFVNDTDGIEIENEILYYPNGTGNDFAHDLGKEKECDPFSIKEYIKDLPCVTVKGKTYRFINGIGYGIDGYCCEVGDEMKKNKPGEKVDYTSIAIKGLLFHYKPTGAKVSVDGKTTEYKKAWIAPTMNGRFYGGGMMPTPAQIRNSGKLSTMIFHDSGKLRTLMIFPSLFKGEHIKHTKYVEVFEGNEITVEFDRPVALQVDGETILGVSSYTAKTAVSAPKKEEVKI